MIFFLINDCDAINKRLELTRRQSECSTLDFDRKRIYLIGGVQRCSAFRYYSSVVSLMVGMNLMLLWFNYFGCCLVVGQTEWFMSECICPRCATWRPMQWTTVTWPELELGRLWCQVNRRCRNATCHLNQCQSNDFWRLLLLWSCVVSDCFRWPREYELACLVTGWRYPRLLN